MKTLYAPLSTLHASRKEDLLLLNRRIEHTNLMLAEIRAILAQVREAEGKMQTLQNDFIVQRAAMLGELEAQVLLSPSPVPPFTPSSSEDGFDRLYADLESADVAGTQCPLCGGWLVPARGARHVRECINECCAAFCQPVPLEAGSVRRAAGSEDEDPERWDGQS